MWSKGGWVVDQWMWNRAREQPDLQMVRDEANDVGGEVTEVVIYFFL